MVRLVEPVSHGGATILLDHRAAAHRGHGQQSSLETAVVLAASISLHLLGADHQVRLISHRGAVLAEGHDISDDVLAGLAVLKPDESTLLRPVVVGGSGLVIAVLGELSRPDALLLAATRRQGVNAVALVMATQEWEQAAGSDAGSRTAVEVLRAADWRVVEVRPGDDLAGAWRRACAADDGYAAVEGGPAERRPA